MNHEQELNQVMDWMNMRIQLYRDFLFTGTRKYQLPTFEEYKKHNLGNPQFVDHREVNANDVVIRYEAGIGSHINSGMYRFWNSFQNTKYYTGGNIEGKWTINSDNIIRSVNPT